MILASPDPTPDKLGGFFAPRNVAVVGMSADDEKFGGVLRQRLLGSDLDRVIAITQRSKMVPGVTVSPSFADIDGPLDLTILSVPTKQVLANVGAAADIGCTNFVICSAGFAEDGDQGEALQRELVALAANRNLRILGPNCLGFVNRLDNVWAGVVRRPVQQSGRHGGIAFISQTGSLGVALFSSKIDEFAYFVSTGNEAGLTFGELARHFALQSNVRVVMGLIESIRDAEQLVAAAAICAQLSKTLVVLKSGRSKVGAESALLHTAAIAGDARVYDALFAENGIVQVRTVEELMGVAALADRFGSGRERRMFVVTTSGGSAVLAADYCEESAMELTQPNEDEQVALAQVLGTSSERVRNPLDVTGINAFRRGVLGNALRIIDASARYGWILVPMGGTLGGTAERRAGEIVESAAELKTAVAPVWQHELVDETGYHILQESALYTFRSLKTAIDCAACLSSQPDVSPVVDVVASGTAVAESESKSILAQAGISTVRDVVCASASESVAAANDLGYPVVVKVHHRDVVHKARIGGVRVGLSSDREVEMAYDGVCHSASDAIGSLVDEVVVEPWVPIEIEFIAGVRRHEQLAAIAVVGLGGRLAEAYMDMAVVLRPVTANKVGAALRGLRIGSVLLSMPIIEMSSLHEGLASLLRRLMDVIEADPSIAGIDVNPVVLTPSGSLIALDAVVQRTEPG